MKKTHNHPILGSMSKSNSHVRETKHATSCIPGSAPVALMWIGCSWKMVHRHSVAAWFVTENYRPTGIYVHIYIYMLSLNVINQLMQGHPAQGTSGSWCVYHLKIIWSWRVFLIGALDWFRRHSAENPWSTIMGHNPSLGYAFVAGHQVAVRYKYLQPPHLALQYPCPWPLALPKSMPGKIISGSSSRGKLS